MKAVAIALVLTLAAAYSEAQWDIQDSHTTASLRGIDNVGNGIAWASGTNGTVLRTEDGGYVWQLCAIPPGAEKLDFRGIQAFDANTAIVMSSGKGDLSRLYKTTDGCQTWKLVFTNPDKEGFWDAIGMWSPSDGFLAGDQVNGHMTLLESASYWNGFEGNLGGMLEAMPNESAFAASNTSIALGSAHFERDTGREVWFATGGSSGSRVIHFRHLNRDEPERNVIAIAPVPSFPKSASAGIFSICMAEDGRGVVVGGDYLKPNDTTGTAAFTTDRGKNWTAAQTPPPGFRSAVAYDAQQKLWITVGPNGTDISTDDGRNWNALSLPYVVGPNGRIGKLRTISVNNSDVRK